jgi:pyruvate dehydrogenase E1 component alpha subunit
MGTALARSEAEIELVPKARAHRIEATVVDGMDVLAVRDAARAAIDAIRGGGGPRFLELRTYRFRAHSMFDPELYRDKAEVESWKKRCPIARLSRVARERGAITDADIAAIEADAAAEVAAACAFAETSPLEPETELARDVTAAAGAPA